MKILLTGANSYLGARLFLDLGKKFNVVGTYHDGKLSNKFIHLDITDDDEIKKVILSQKSEIIIHAASNADARWCEVNPKLAAKINQKPTREIVKVANQIGARIIYISSYAATKPLNVYGKTKFISEKYVETTEKGYVILRPSLIIGFSPNTVNDRPFNRILSNIDNKTEAVYDTSWKFQPTYIGHISEMIIQIIEKRITNQTISIAVNEIKTRYNVAKDILEPFNIEVKPVDRQDKTLVIIDNLKKLKELNLPKYTYKEIIKKVIDEIKNRDLYSKI